MKKRINLLKTAVLLLTTLSLVSCNKKAEISVLVNNIWFPSESCVQELAITANCKWSVNIDDHADWYTIDPMSGRNDKVLKITVKALDDAEQRSSYFTITSDKGKVQIKVRVAQNTDEPTELRSITNMIFGVASFSHWNVDYLGEVVEGTYKRYDYNPYDTASGYVMYFMEDSIGVQRDNINGDSTTYYPFKYAFDPDTRIIHLDFETVDETQEIYDAPVLIATEEVFRFQHEYKSMRWELADMRKVGTLQPHEKTRIMKATKKRKSKEGVFRF